jgi:replicative DNA helicase
VVNITFTLDDQIAQRAKAAAQKMGKNLDQVVLDYLEQLAGSTQRDQEWARFEQSCLTSGGKLNGWKFNRDEANQR